MTTRKDIFFKKPGEPACADDVFRVVFDRIQTGILIIEPETHTIIDANPIAEQLIGLTRDKLVGNVCHDFVCPAKCGECPVTDLRKDIRNIERVLINARGEQIPILKTVARAEVNGREFLIESFIDIIDRKKAEERRVVLLAYLNESLMRVKNPLELTRQGIQGIADMVRDGEFDREDIRMQLQLHARNIGQISRNIEELSRQAIEDRTDIPQAFREYLIGK